jgi:hypothetical protein
MLPTVCFVALLLAFFAALGRSVTPRAERVPWTRWTGSDLLATVVLGVRRLVELHERNPMASHQRTPHYSDGPRHPAG